MQNLHLLLCISLIICGLLVIFSYSPIESMIALILRFCISGIILFIFNSEFLGITFIIIYVGAIAVLFLFIIMMLNIKKSKSFFNYKRIIAILVALFSIFLVFILYKDVFLLTLDQIYSIKYNTSERYLSKELNNIYYDSLGNITLLGQCLFNYYSISFLLSGLVLLIALIGSIVLTINFNSHKKHQLDFRQLSRTSSFLSYLKKK